MLFRSDRIKLNGWMGEATKASALAKLSRMDVMVGYPAKFRDYAPLAITAGDLYGNVQRASAFNTADNMNELGKRVDRAKWTMNPQTINAYNGGLENYPRFHENWNGAVTYTYRGSFVSLNKPRHVNGAWVYGGMVYTAPVRNWNYDVSFNAAQNLPPITPRFVYLKQQLFVRDYDQS